ncbi:AbrB/MazE/SpoVT family DNA-binding domain-containing protein [Ruminococcus flavefaciens]|uniref:AbrB/MazE/SpoVT family DNA-binding domain-containing protein n=1 Tax=Ruminococcus flavefaciens TaxID=1265 RepID=UPI00156615A7|nr:AbrB/MazE/SpoVT family DNA-binding domain-containing protein [Ruminococcus flavefaciens]
MMNANGIPVSEKKRVRISSKRQITIPQKYFSMLGFEDTAECVVRGNELVIRPVRVSSGGEFSEQILAGLIKEGFSGNELLEKFRERQAKVRPAVEAMIAEAEKAANGETEYSTYEDIFGTKD